MADTLEIFGVEYTNVAGIIATTPSDTDLTYIRPQGTKSISANGTGIDVAEYASVDVSVPSGSPTLQTKTKTYTPTTSQQTESVMADSGYDGLDAVNVTVNAMPMGTIADRAPINYLVAEASFDSQTGMFTAFAEIAEVINPVTQSGYVTTGAETELEADASDTYQLTMRSSSDLTASGATVTAPSGYYPSSATKTVASGSATPASSISATGATVSTGTNTLTLSKSVSNTPTVSAGYISSGTAGNSSVSLTASINTRSSSDLTASGATVTAPAGYYAEAVSKSVTTMTLPTAAASSATSGYTSKATIGRSTAAQYINIPPGYNSTGAYYVISAVANGSATGPTSLSGSSATITTGTNTITLTKTGISTTPTVSAGYVSSATASTATVALTASVTTKAAATITPGTTNQTIASGTYLTGTQTIVGDADLVGSNILSTANIFGVQGTVDFTDVYIRSAAPTSSVGNDGDIYIQE